MREAPLPLSPSVAAPLGSWLAAAPRAVMQRGTLARAPSSRCRIGIASLVLMSPQEERAFRNEALFREVNVHIADLEKRLQYEGESLSLLCECARSGCAVPIEVDPITFERVRENPLWFLVAPGHEQPDIELIVERPAGSLIVEKRAS